MEQRKIYRALMILVILLPIMRMISYPLKMRDSMILPGIFLMLYFLYSMKIIAVESAHKRVPWKNYLLPYACMIVPWVLSFVVAFTVVSPKQAFIGVYDRCEGLLQMGSYVGIFILASMLNNSEYRAKLIYVFLGIVSIFSVIGLLQFLNIYSFGDDFYGMASYPIGNPNFYASLMVLFSGVAMAGVWLYEENSKFFHPFLRWNRTVWIVLTVLSYIGCVAARSTSAYVGLLMIFLLLLFLDIVSKKKRLQWIGIMFLLLSCVVFVLNLFSDGAVWEELITNFVVIKEEGSIFGDRVGTNRLEIWKQVFGLLRTYWLFGCGVENLGDVYLAVYGRNKRGRIVDKAHNEYLDVWISQGIIPIVLYLILLFALFIPGILQYIKKKQYQEDDIRKMAIVPFFGYIAQAFFNVRMISVAPYFWLICGFLLVKRKSKTKKD